MKHKINIVGFSRDGGDGSGSTGFYNDLDELQSIERLSDEEIKIIVDEYDPYENGLIEHIEIEIEEIEGMFKITPFSSGWGQ